jgi:hypothetical protein
MHVHWLAAVSGGEKARVDGGELRLRRPWRPGRGEDAVVLAAVQDAARRAKGAVACGHPGQPLRAPAFGDAAGTEGWPWLSDYPSRACRQVMMAQAKWRSAR